MGKPTLSEENRVALQRLADVVENGSHYQLLDVDPDADANAIQDAYYQLSRTWHPDRFFRMDLGEEGEKIERVFVSITHAYKALSDPLKRRDYDRNELPRFSKRRSHRDAHQERLDSVTVPGSTAARPRSSSVRSTSTASRSTSGRSSESRRGRASSSPAQDPGSTPSGATRSPRRRTWREQARLNSSRGKRTREKAESRSSASGGPSASTAERVRAKPRRNSNMDRIKEEMKARVQQARRYYDQGALELEEGQIIKAASSLYLATTYQPENETYKAAFEDANTAARKIQARQFVVQAEAAESYQRVKEAIAHYRKATELDETNGRANFRLALLIRRYEEDDREALFLLRRAVQAEPKDTDFRMALGDIYADLGMALNAQREYKTVLGIDNAHQGAKDALKKVR